MYIFRNPPQAGEEAAWIAQALRIGDCFDVIFTHKSQDCKAAYAALAANGIILEDSVHILVQFKSQQPWLADTLLQAQPMAVIQEIFRHLGDQGTIHLFTSSGFLYALLSFAPDAYSETAFRAQLTEIAKALYSEWNLELLVSRSERGRDGIFHAANSIRQGHEYFSFFEHSGPIQFLDIRKQTLLGNTSDATAYQRLSERLTEQMEEPDFNPQEAAKQVLQTVTARSALSIEALHSQMLSFSMAFLLHLKNSSVVDDDFLTRLELSERIMQGDRASLFEKNLANLLQQIYQRRMEVKAMVDTERLQQVRIYVEQHISWLNLSVSAVADQFGMNRSTLTAQFRAMYGVSLAEFIQKARLERAILLLETHPSRPMEQIAADAGYGSLSTMYRAFQRNGMRAPAEYRGAAGNGA